MDKIEEKFYEIACDEVLQKTPVRSIMGKAISEAMGDKEKIVALYIKYRVKQLGEEYQDELQKRAEEFNRVEKLHRQQEWVGLKGKPRYPNDVSLFKGNAPYVKKCSLCNVSYDNSWGICIYCGKPLL